MATYVLTIGNDSFVGTDGDDLFDGYNVGKTDGIDTLYGGGGDDLFELANATALDGGVLDAGDGEDVLRLSGHGTPMLSNVTLTNFEVLELGNGSVGTTISQLNSFRSIISVPTWGPTFGLSGQGGTLDLSSKLTAGIGAYISCVGLTSGANVTGTSQSDRLYGSLYADVLFGGDGDDYINDFSSNGMNLIYGGSGNDEIYAPYTVGRFDGGDGDDKFRVDGPCTVIGGAGVDMITTSNLRQVTISGVEILGSGSIGTIAQFSSFSQIGTAETDGIRLDLVGPGGRFDSSRILSNNLIGIDATRLASGATIIGSSRADMIAGSFHNDVLYGGAGNDLIVADQRDLVLGGAGNDVFHISGSTVRLQEAAGQGYDSVESDASFVLPEHIESLRLFNHWAVRAIGNSSNNRIEGSHGDNVIDGRSGADLMIGLGGSDTYVVDNAGDVVRESAVYDGVDHVFTSINFNLGLAARAQGRIENLTLTGTAFLGVGNNFSNRIAGNASRNCLDGGAQADTLTGGAGNDTFRFSSALGATNMDTIVDFNVVQDTIQLDNAVMAALGAATGALGAAKFAANASGMATTAAQRIVYDTDNGQLYYDSNGSAAGGRIQFAKVAPGLAMTSADFVVI